jgi:hypothetical protein
VAFEAVSQPLFLFIFDILSFYDEICAFGAEDVPTESAMVSPTNDWSELFRAGEAT